MRPGEDRASEAPSRGHARGSRSRRGTWARAVSHHRLAAAQHLLEQLLLLEVRRHVGSLWGLDRLFVLHGVASHGSYPAVGGRSYDEGRPGTRYDSRPVGNCNPFSGRTRRERKGLRGGRHVGVARRGGRPCHRGEGQALKLTRHKAPGRRFLSVWGLQKPRSRARAAWDTPLAEIVPLYALLAPKARSPPGGECAWHAHRAGLPYASSYRRPPVRNGNACLRHFAGVKREIEALK